MKKILCIIPTLNSYFDVYLVQNKDKDLHLILLVENNIYQTLKNRYKNNTKIKTIYSYEANNIYDINIDKNKLLTNIKKENLQQTIIFDKIKNKSIQFLENIHQPDFAHLYPLVRFSYLSDIKNIFAYGIGFMLDLSVPMLLDNFVDIHKGERAFIVGNGPSLNDIDMSLLKNEITFGSNRVYLGFEKWGFKFNYWTIADRLQIEEHLDEWAEKKNLSNGIVKFIPFEYKNLMNLQNYCPVNFHYSVKDFPKFSITPSDIYLGYTVVHMSLQIAAIMGIKELYMIGVDHNYNLTNTLTYKNAKIWTSQTTGSQTHFDKTYNDPENNRRFITPKPEKAEEAFEQAYTFAKKYDIKIFNATKNSKLEVIPKIKFESLFL